MDGTGRCACGTYTESSSGLCAGCINRSRVYGSSVPTIVGTPFDPHNCTVPMEMADASPSQPVVTGRRRCGIPEHRRQIKYLQKWCHYVQNTQSANWHRIRAAEMEVEKLRLELREAYRLLGEASGSEVSTGHTTKANTMNAFIASMTAALDRISQARQVGDEAGRRRAEDDMAEIIKRAHRGERVEVEPFDGRMAQTGEKD